MIMVWVHVKDLCLGDLVAIGVVVYNKDMVKIIVVIKDIVWVMVVIIYMIMF